MPPPLRRGSSCSPSCRSTALELLRLLPARPGDRRSFAREGAGHLRRHRARARRARALDAPPRRRKHLHGGLRRRGGLAGLRGAPRPRRRALRRRAQGGALRICLILLAWQVSPAHPLIVAANRDEFHARPASVAAWWKDRPAILAGRDLEAGGT